MGGGEWTDPDRVARWIERRELVPGGEKVARTLYLILRDRRITRILDLGTGDGRVIAGLRAMFPEAEAVGIDLSPAMLGLAEARFADDRHASFAFHDLDDPLPPDLGRFDLVISAQAIHHLSDERKRSLYREAFEYLAPGGICCNIDLVALPSAAKLEWALEILGIPPAERDDSDQPASVESQLAWLREAGFVEVDCYWKWLAGAVMVGERPR